MCIMCERPDLTTDDVLDDVRARIARNRFTVLGVRGSRCDAEFSYTAGLTEHGLPELVVTGQRAETAARLVGLWAEYLLERPTHRSTARPPSQVRWLPGARWPSATRCHDAGG